MVTSFEVAFIGLCLEGFLYGVYSGIFAIYLKRPPNSTRTGILFFALCLLYVLTAATFVDDLVTNILTKKRLDQANNSPSQLESVDLESLLFRLSAIQIAVTGCSDFLAQCILIYRCWIVWGQNIRVVIIPSFLAIAYLATILAVTGATTIVQGVVLISDWGFSVALTTFGLSMAVNTLVTGLIVFKILKVFLEVKLTSVEQALGTTGRGGTPLRHVIFVIIESGMALFAIQLVHFVFYNLPDLSTKAYNLSTVFYQMFNGIAPTVILVRVSMRLSFDDEESFKEAAGSLRFNNSPTSSDSDHDQDSNTDNHGSDPNTTPALQRMGSMLPKDSERNEDICFNNSPCDPDTVRRMGSNSSMPPQERSASHGEDT